MCRIELGAKDVTLRRCPADEIESVVKPGTVHS